MSLQGRLRLTAFCKVGYGAARSVAFRPLLVFGIFPLSRQLQSDLGSQRGVGVSRYLINGNDQRASTHRSG